MVDRPISAYFLRKHPQIIIDGNPEKISSQSLSLLMYVADNGDTEYNREELATLLYGSKEAREKLRQEALFRLPERLRTSVFGTEQREIIQFIADDIWIDSREFSQQATELLQEGPTFKKKDYLKAKEILELYNDAFGLDFNPTSAKQTNNYNFLKWKQKRQQKLADLYHALLDRVILYCLRQKSRWAEAEAYAEKWLGSINPNATPLQYLIWLAANQQSPSLSTYLEQLQKYESESGVLGGFIADEWRTMLKSHRPLSLSIFASQAQDESPEPLPTGVRSALLGRTDTIEEILQLFLSSGEASVFAITGLPGVGKSEIARTAAQALREKSNTYRVVELELTEDMNLEQLCNTILSELGRNEVLGLDYGAKRRQLKQLIHSPNLFVIVDEGHTNAFTDSTMLQNVLDLVDGARVMVAARKLPRFDRYLIEIGGLNWEHTKTFFIERVPRLTHLSDSQFKDIAMLTGGLPLLLQIIAGFIKKELSRTTSLIDRLKLLSEEVDLKENAALAYAAILDWLFQYMDGQERYLLYTISLFSPSEGATFADLKAVFSSIVVPEKVKGKLNRLVDLHLVETQQTGDIPTRYRLHPIIFEFVKREAQKSRRVYFPFIEKAYINTLLDYANTYHDQPTRLDEHQQNIIHMLNMVFLNEDNTWALPQAIEVMNKIYPYFEKRGLYVLASKLFNRACELNRFVTPSLHIQTVYRAGKIEYLQTNLDQALRRYEQALALSQEYESNDHLGNIYFSFGSVYLRRAEFKTMTASLEIAETWATRNQQIPLLYSIWSNMGVCAHTQGQLETAHKYYRKVLEHLGNNLLNLSPELQLIAQHIQTTLGLINNDLNRPDQAKHHFEQSLSLARHLEYPEQLGYVYLNLGITYYQTKDYDAANDCFVQGGIIADRIQHVELQTQLQWNQGALASTRFQHKEALYLLRSALIQADKYDLQGIKPRIVIGLGKAYLRMESFNSSLECFTQALIQPSALLHHWAQSLYGIGLSVMLRKFVIGNQDVEITLEQLTPVLNTLTLPKLPANELFIPKLEEAEAVFQRELDHFPELGRYRLVEALKIWFADRSA